MTRESSDSLIPATGEARASQSWNRMLGAVLVIGIATRILLAVAGRTTVIDGFYLHAAFRLSKGDAPYLDFTQVAFPVLEQIYAFVFRFASDRLLAASLVTGAAVLATALLLACLIGRAHGALAGALAGIAYETSAHVFAWHLFEREMWTNLGLAAALCIAFSRPRTRDRMAVAIGLVLAVTITLKVTSVVGAIAIGLVLLRRDGWRAALLAAAGAALPLLAFTLLLFARYGAEFAVQTFVFYFFKGESSTLAERLRNFLHYADGAMLIGAAGLLIPGPLSARGAGAGETVFGVSPLPGLRLLAACLLVHYGLLSPSYWDHNALDLLLPLAGGAGMFLATAVRSRSVVRFAVAAGLAILGTHAFESTETRWPCVPHGFGSDVREDFDENRRALEAGSAPGDRVVAPNPLVCAVIDRTAFVTDFELEPVARGLLHEIRLRGLASAMRRRHQGVLLGQPDPGASQSTANDLFGARIAGNIILHAMPRVLDAAARRELAVILAGNLPPDAKSILAKAGYVPLDDPELTGFVRR